MQKYKVLAPAFTDVNGVEFKQGATIALDSSYPIEDLIREGAIELIPAEIKKFTVVKGPIANLAREVFQTGNTIELVEDDELTVVFLRDGIIVPEGTKLPSAESNVGAPISAPVEPGTSGDTEPRKRYRGQVVLSENDRTVGEQTFRHIVCANGTEYDLTDVEYKGEVHVSYPTQQ